MAKLPWAHNCLLLEKIKDTNIRIWYANKCLENDWLKDIIKDPYIFELENIKETDTKEVY